MSAAPGALRVEQLDVYVGRSHVVHGASFDAPAGQVTALLGRNGAGKTTTLRGVLGLAHRTGAAWLDGDDLVGRPTHAVVGLGVGYVPEDREVFSSLTVEENLRLARRSWSDDRSALVDRLFPALRTRAAQRAGTLSGGEQQMLALGRVLANDNRLLLVDEPTKGLAPLVVEQVVEAFETAVRGLTVVLVEQNLGVVRRLATHVVVLDDGRVAYTGALDDLVAQPALVRSLLGVEAQAV
jgi:branched-chain amino acid transport system ATP-binding protein